jgi:hypothetical protein
VQRKGVVRDRQPALLSMKSAYYSTEVLATVQFWPVRRKEIRTCPSGELPLSEAFEIARAGSWTQHALETTMTLCPVYCEKSSPSVIC